METKKETKKETIKEPIKKSIKITKEGTNVFISIKNTIKDATGATSVAYKKNIDSVLGLLSYALFALSINGGINLYNGANEASWVKPFFDLFCAITLIIAKKRVQKGSLSDFFETTQNNKPTKAIHDFFVDDEDGSEDIIEIK